MQTGVCVWRRPVGGTDGARRSTAGVALRRSTLTDCRFPMADLPRKRRQMASDGGQQAMTDGGLLPAVNGGAA